MPKTHSKQWTRDEMILVLDLYRRYDGRLYREAHAEVQILAYVLGRTPAGIKMRLENFQAIDPDDPRTGLPGGSQVKFQQVWDDYYRDSGLRPAASMAAFRVLATRT